MEEIQEIYLKDYKKPEFKIEEVNLTFELEEESTIVTNVMKIQSLSEETKDLDLNSIDLELLEVWINDLKVCASIKH